MQLAALDFSSGCSAWLAPILFQKYLILNAGDVDQWDRNSLNMCGKTRLDCW